MNTGEVTDLFSKAPKYKITIGIKDTETDKISTFWVYSDTIPFSEKLVQRILEVGRSELEEQSLVHKD